jgi:hypothetical protein
MNDMVYLPLTNMSAEIVGNNALTGVAINGFWLKSSNADRLEAAEFQVTNVLWLRHNIHPPRESGGRFCPFANCWGIGGRYSGPQCG